MLISMKKTRFFLALLSVLTILLMPLANSCITFKVKNIKNPENVEQKIYDEFKNNIDKKDFFSACKSYIEYKNCCSEKSNSKSNLMLKLLKKMYSEKIELLLSEGKIEAVNLSYSMYNLVNEESSAKKDGKIDYKKDLIESINYYINKGLKDKSDIEKASLYMYLSLYDHGYYYPYEKLVELFIKRKNWVLADKYYQKLKGIFKDQDKINTKINIYPPLENYQKRLDEFSSEIKKLRESEKDKDKVIQEAIASTIDSSVKILVDRGIKTEGGRGIPDQMLGTGVVLNNNGYIITNYHIIESSVDPKYEGYSKIYVIPGRDEEFENLKLVAEVYGYDKIFDLAVLKVVKELPTKIKFGDSDRLKEGERVIAIGNPVGLTNTVTSGVVSATKRSFIQIGNIIQIDAALNPGNSGGALINNYGYLVGITFAGFLNFQNLNFAIPSNLILNDIFKLFIKGEVKRSWIGCSVEKKDKVIQVNYVVPESNAEISGLRVGDVIKSVNSKDVKEIYDIQKEISFFESPVVIPMLIERDGKDIPLIISIGKRPTYPARYIKKVDTIENIITPLFGIVLTNIETGKRKYHSIERIIPGSPAAEFGIAEGDEILLRSINFDKKNGVFSLIADLRSKRFGFLNKTIVIYNYEDINSFI